MEKLEGKLNYVLLEKHIWTTVMFLLNQLEMVEEGYNKKIIKDIINNMENLKDAPK